MSEPIWVRSIVDCGDYVMYFDASDVRRSITIPKSLEKTLMLLGEKEMQSKVLAMLNEKKVN